MGKWTQYPIKKEPVGDDEVMIRDTEGKSNKRVLISDFLDQLAKLIQPNAVYSEKSKTSFTEMLANGLNINLNGSNLIGIGYASADFPYPYIILGDGVSPKTNTSGMIKFYNTGVWVGDTTDKNSSKIISGTGLFITLDGTVSMYVKGKEKEIGTGGGGTVDPTEIIEQLKPYINEQIQTYKPVAVFG